jgi:ABC-type transport system involved in multi-copper enzyme maturation permease subunit
MSTIALTNALTRSHLRTSNAHRPHPLLSVLAWELRRFRASRLFWLQALGFFGLLLLLMWYGRMPAQFGVGDNASVFVAGTSAWGLLMILPIDALVLMLLLPFVNADGVTRDLQRRTHELLMTTPLPSWAYVWGRYLIALLMSLGLALLFLAAIFGMGWLLHLTTPDYPAPEIGALLLLWGGMVVPGIILVSSLSFALGTAFPRQTALVKIVILVAWIGGAVILPDLVSRPAAHSSLPAWYVNWDLTSRATAIGASSQYQTAFDGLSRTAVNSAQFQHLLNGIANKMPDISARLAPHLLEALLSLLLVVLAAFTFRRFRLA